MTAPVMMPNCPSDETLAAFIDGHLTGDARQQVIEHLSICSECRDVVQTAHEFAEESDPKANVVPIRSPWLIPGATLAAVAAIAAVVFLGPADGYWRERYTRQLTAATAKLDERPIAARPSIDIAYKDRRNLRGAGDKSTAQYELLMAAAKLGQLAEDRPTAANLQSAGVAYLLAGKDYADEGVLLLEKAQAKTRAPNADLLNDLAAGYYATEKYDKAGEAIERAWQLKKSPNIAWTRATILETAQAWKDYLAIDSTTGWAAEAKEELERFED